MAMVLLSSPFETPSSLRPTAPQDERVIGSASSFTFLQRASDARVSKGDLPDCSSLFSTLIPRASTARVLKGAGEGAGQ